MNDKEIDDLLLTELKYMLIGSRMRTCLNIKIGDFASQCLGYRNSRHIPGNDKDAVEDVFIELTSKLFSISYHLQDLLQTEHKYKASIYSLSSEELEILLEDSIYDAVIYDTLDQFKEQFLE